MSNLLEKASILLTPTAYDDGRILSVKPSIALGEDLITNGDFATDLSGWSTFNTDATNTVTWETDGARIISTTNLIGIQQNNVLTIGKSYKLTCDVAVTTGSISVDAATAGATIALVEGFNEIYFTAVSNFLKIKRTTGNSNCLLDNVSVKEDLSGDFDFTRNSSATRVNSQGLIEDMQTFSGNLVSNGDFSQEGSELITNGDFSNGSTGWSKSTQVTIENGVANIISNDGSFQYVGQNNITTIGKSYVLTYTIISNNNGDLRFGNFGGINSTIGTHSFYFVADETACNIARNSAGVTDISLDNVSVKEVGQDWNLGTDWGIGNNKAIRTGTTSSVLTQSGTFSLGKKFKLNFTITDWTTGNLEGYFYGGGGSDTFFNISNIGNGTFTFETTTTTNRTNIAFYASGGFDGSITNVSVIEITDDTNLPRIDYSPYSGAGTCGHWLFEPQSTNLFTYSNDFSQWSSLSGASVINNALVSPDGTLNADEFVFDGTNNGRIEKQVPTTNGLDYTFSIYLKNKDIANPTQVFIGNAGGVEGRFVTITNEWQRFTNTQTANGTSEFPRVNYNGVGSLYAYGAQFEQNSYTTSYIPTSGSTVTRNQEAAFGSGNSSLINSTEGVLYTEIAALTQRPSARRDIALSDGTRADNIVRIHYLNGVDNTIRVQVRSGGTITASVSTTVTDIRDFHKVAISYKVNEVKFYIDGVLINTDTNAAMPIGLNQLSFSDGDGTQNRFFGKTKCVAVFKEALTDDELECLTSDETSFSSFNALALANNYTII